MIGAVAAVQRSVEALIFGLDVLGGGGSGGIASISAFSQTQERDLFTSATRVYPTLRAGNAATRQAATCPDGGTVDVTETETQLMIVFNNCTERTISNGILLEESVLDLTITITLDRLTTCGGETLADAFHIVLNGFFSFKEDTDADGTLEVDETGTAQNFTVAISDANLDPDTCDLIGFTASESGRLSFSNKIDSDASFSLNVSSNTPIVITSEVVTGGVNLSINGSLSFDSTCFDGSLTVDTTETVFVPFVVVDGEEELADCPSAGKIAITGDARGTVTYNASGGVEIDEGSNNTVDMTFGSCEDVEICM